MCGERSIVKNSARFVWAILALALLLRVAWAIAVPVQPLSDSLAYDVFAQNLAKGYGFGWSVGNPTPHWAPGVALVYAPFYFLFGHTYLPIVLLNIGLGVFIVAATMQLAKWWFNPRVSLVTGLLLALWLNLIEFTTILASELLFCALLLSALLVWEHPTLNRTSRALGAGVLLAAASYMRPIGMALPAVFFILEWRRLHGSSRTPALRAVLAATLLLVVTMAVVIAPWTLRNALTFGRVILISDNAGRTFWSGNNPAGDGKTSVPVPRSTLENTADPYLTLTAQAFTYISTHPLAFAAGLVQKLIWTHSRESIGVVWNGPGLTARWGAGVLLPLKAVNAAYWYLMLALALVGIALLWKVRGWRGFITEPTLWLWAYFALVATVFVGQDRYHIPSIPFIAMLASYALVYLYAPLRAKATHIIGSPHSASLDPKINRLTLK